MGKIICHCYQVSKKDIKSAIKNGASTFKELKEVSKISTGCGKCKKKSKKYFKAQYKKYRKQLKNEEIYKNESV